MAAQDMAGATISKYSLGISAHLNPSLPVLSPLYLDVNVASASLFAENNYIYIKKDENKLRRFFSQVAIDPEVPAMGNDDWYSDYDVPGIKSGYISARVIGPSVSMVMGAHAFGISYSLRSVTSVRNIPAPLAKFMFEGMYFPTLHDIRFVHEEKMSTASLTWGELAVNYSAIFSVKNRNVWSGGIAIKQLHGLAGFSFYSDHLDYMVAGYDTLRVYSADAKIGIAVPLNYDNNDYDGGFKGNGYGVDLGVTFERKKSPVGWLSVYNRMCAQSYTSYHYRIGLSVVDLGRIRFTENALQAELNNNSLYWPGIRSMGNTTINRVTDTLSNRIFGNPTQMITGSETSIGLPATVILHGDYNFHSNWMASAIILLPLNAGSESAVIRPSVLTGGVRYETYKVSAGLTASLQGIYGIDHGLHKFQVGFNARFHGFFIGTGNIISFLKLTDYTGSDLYAGIRFNFLKGRCRYSGARCPDMF